MFIPLILLRLIIVFVLGLAGFDLDSNDRHDADHSPARAIVTVDEAPADEPTDPVDEPTAPADEPIDPVDEPAGPGKLTVDTGNISLPFGVYAGSFTLSNVGGSALEWAWVGDPRLDLSEDNGVLAAGESVVVTYEVDPGTLNAGENLLANCVVHDDGAIDVWITVTKPAPLPTIPAHLTS
jgi:hypothetical protein